MAETILIVEDEPDIAYLVALNLETAGYECKITGYGEDAIRLALEIRPDLVLLDVMLPDIDGVEVCRMLRKDPRTATAGIIMLTARTLTEERVNGLEAGADDYIGKPFELPELLARVRTSLRRTRQLRAASPLTGLPGNFEIEARLDARIADGADFALLHVDVDGFKGYNDRYGFLRGDRAIVVTARVVTEAVQAAGGPGTFIGHIGGDDFAVVCDVASAEPVAVLILERFDASVEALYDAEDRAAGFIEMADRTGTLHRHPFLTVSIGVASSRVRPFTSSTEAAAVAAEMKRFAKAVSGSAWRVDRRQTV